MGLQVFKQYIYIYIYVYLYLYILLSVGKTYFGMFGAAVYQQLCLFCVCFSPAPLTLLPL